MIRLQYHVWFFAELREHRLSLCSISVPSHNPKEILVIINQGHFPPDNEVYFLNIKSGQEKKRWKSIPNYRRIMIQKTKSHV